jgi:hypothetical protein
MKIETIVALIACVISCGGILVFIGRSLGTLTSVGKAVEIALAKTDKHDAEIARIDKELATVKTRQDDCDNCPG